MAELKLTPCHTVVSVAIYAATEPECDAEAARVAGICTTAQFGPVTPRGGLIPGGVFGCHGTIDADDFWMML